MVADAVSSIQVATHQRNFKVLGLPSVLRYQKILDFWCLDMGYPMVYLCCSAGKHRSPMVGFCWLLSQPGATLESVAGEFFGDFNTDGHDILWTYHNDVKKGYIPEDLPGFYKAMHENPGTSYRNLTQGMLLYERITYSENKSVIL